MNNEKVDEKPVESRTKRVINDVADAGEEIAKEYGVKIVKEYLPKIIKMIEEKVALKYSTKEPKDDPFIEELITEAFKHVLPGILKEFADDLYREYIKHVEQAFENAQKQAIKEIKENFTLGQQVGATNMRKSVIHAMKDHGLEQQQIEKIMNISEQYFDGQQKEINNMITSGKVWFDMDGMKIARAVNCSSDWMRGVLIFALKKR